MAKGKNGNGADHSADEDIEITLDAPEPELVGEKEIALAEKDVPEVKEPPAAVPAEEGIEALKANLEREKSGRLAAEAREREATARANSAGKEVQDTNLTLVTTAIANTTAALDRMEADYAQALADGDHREAAKINRLMNEGAVELQTLTAGKLQLEEEAKRPPPQEVRADVDPVEFIANQLTPRSAAWVRAHPDHATGQKFNAMVAADQLARARGFAADSDEYFADVEDTLKIRRREPEREEESALSEAAEGTRRQSPAAAPVSRGGGMDGQKRPGTVRLSAAEVEMAQAMGQTVQEYAAEKAALIAEGKLVN